MNIFDRLYGAYVWRYRKYIQPYLLQDKDMLSFLKRKYLNKRYSECEHVICYINADDKNMGDRLSSLGIQYLTKKPGVKLFASASGLNETRRTINDLQRSGKTLYVIVGGGGLLQDCFTGFWEMLLDQRVKFSIIGVGANLLEPNRQLLPTKLIRELGASADFIHIRDEFTKLLLSNVCKNEIYLGVCPSINYLYDLHRCKKEVPKKYLLHVMHEIDIRMAGFDPETIRNQVEKVATSLHLRYREVSHVGEKFKSLIKIYHQSKYVVSSRLHGCIFSYGLGIPFVGFDLDQKIKSFFATHHDENALVKLPMDYDSLLIKLTNQQSKLVETQNSLKEKVAYNNELISNLINRRVNSEE